MPNRSGGVRERRPLFTPRPAKPNIENDARRNYEAGEPHETSHYLPIPWKAFLTNLPRPQFNCKLIPAQLARERLDEICHRTNTFIATPSDSSLEVKIWGSEEDAQNAVHELETFIHDVRTRGERPNRAKWVKEPAHDGRVEDRAVRDLRAENLQAAIYQSNQQSDFPFEALLLWPERIDVNDFRQRYETTVLRTLQTTMECRIEFFNGNLKYVKISAREEQHIHSIYQRVINLMRESIAQNGLFSRINRFLLPSISGFRDKVGLDRDPQRRLMIPTLFGSRLPSSEETSWSKLCTNSKVSNNAMLKTELDSIIRAIQAPGQQVRMRVVFTELGFSRHMKPADGSEHYGIEEFMDMMTQPQVNLDMVGLRSDANLGKLVDIISDMEEFTNLENRFTLHFDFTGQSNSTLRYEREMYMGFENELEDEANRWLCFAGSPKDTEILEFNVLDFEHLRTNYVIHIGKTPLFDPREPQRKFESGVQYRHDPSGVKARPQRRVVFPPGYENLEKHRETSIARWNFKGPDARFELVRRDTFVGAQSGKTPTETMWFAQYYYPEWDTLFGDFGNLKPGDPVPWSKRLETFFPPDGHYSDNPKPLPSFRKFVDEIHDIQKCLQKAIGILELGGRGKGKEREGDIGHITGVAKGVNGVTKRVNGMTVS